jgi:hypothetical protein
MSRLSTGSTFSTRHRGHEASDHSEWAGQLREGTDGYERPSDGYERPSDGYERPSDGYERPSGRYARRQLIPTPTGGRSSGRTRVEAVYDEIRRRLRQSGLEVHER